MKNDEKMMKQNGVVFVVLIFVVLIVAICINTHSSLKFSSKLNEPCENTIFLKVMMMMNNTNAHKLTTKHIPLLIYQHYISRSL